MADGGVFVCSGIVDIRESDVVSAIEGCGLKIIDRHTSGGWVALTATLN